jgi:hypothetical protein
MCRHTMNFSAEGKRAGCAFAPGPQSPPRTYELGFGDFDGAPRARTTAAGSKYGLSFTTMIGRS